MWIFFVFEPSRKAWLLCSTPGYEQQRVLQRLVCSPGDQELSGHTLSLPPMLSAKEPHYTGLIGGAAPAAKKGVCHECGKQMFDTKFVGGANAHYKKGWGQSHTGRAHSHVLCCHALQPFPNPPNPHFFFLLPQWSRVFDFGCTCKHWLVFVYKRSAPLFQYSLVWLDCLCPTSLYMCLAWEDLLKTKALPSPVKLPDCWLC